MFFLRSESESSAGFQPAVSQDFIQPADRTCQTVQVNAIGLQVKNLRHSRTGVLRYAFGLTLTNEAPEAPEKPPKNHVAPKELKPFCMQFKKDGANPRKRKEDRNPKRI